MGEFVSDLIEIDGLDLDRTVGRTEDDKFLSLGSMEILNVFRKKSSCEGCPVFDRGCLPNERSRPRDPARTRRGGGGETNARATGPQTTHVQVKYWTPSFAPSCLPRWGSSHSTPSQVPGVPRTGPMNLIVPMCPERDMRVPILGGVAAMVVQGYFRSRSKVISDLYFTHISSATWWCERVTGGGPSEPGRR
jgi:hypothetical protein